MKLRKAVSTDLESIQNLFRETVNTVNRKDYSAEQLEAWSSGSSDQNRWLKKINEQYFLVAEDGLAVVGFASINQEGYLDTMFVHKDYQRKGIASNLIEALIFYARTNDVSEVITDGSITARPFFEKYGFKVIEKQSVNRKGIPITNFKMSKKL